MVEVTSGGGKGVWSDSPPAYPVLPGVTLRASSLLSSSPHIPATTQLLTVTGLPRQWGAVHPAARDPPVTLGRIPQWTHIWTLGVTMLAKRNGHDPPPQHSRSWWAGAWRLASWPCGRVAGRGRSLAPWDWSLSFRNGRVATGPWWEKSKSREIHAWAVWLRVDGAITLSPVIYGTAPIRFS